MYCRPARGPLPLAALGLPPVAQPLDPVAARVIVVDCMEVVQLVVSRAVIKHLSLSSHQPVEKAPPSFTGD